jgi:hypothetical protein
VNRKALLIVLTIAIAVVASACSSPSPTVTISTPPPASMEINTSASIAATTTHDKNEGVTWSCSPSPCGSFNPTVTLSGASTVYTAPSSSGSVTITATSNKKATVTATATVTITPIATVGSLTGTYTFFANGFDANGFPYSVAGSVALDGAGNITGGEQDLFDTGTPTIITDDPITPATGVVAVGDDGRGSITITPTTAAPETLSFAVVNNNHALIIEFDANATSGGSLDFQTAPASLPAMGNAFTVNDIEDAFVFGGVVTSNGTTGFSAGEADDDSFGTVNFGFDPSVGSSFSATDVAGRSTISLFDATAGTTLQFASYVVGPEAFRLIEIDGDFFAAGSMYGQGAAGSGASAALLTGSFIFTEAGRTNVGVGLYGAAGQFTTDGTAAFTAGVADANLGGGTADLAVSLVTPNAYFVDGNGYGGIALAAPIDTATPALANFGVYLTDPNLNLADPNNTAGGGGALTTNLDVNSFGDGIVVPQATGASFAGNFAFNQDGIAETATPSVDLFDFVGQVLSDGVSAYAGLADDNDIGTNGAQSAGVSVAGTFAADAANPGRATGTVTVNGATTPQTLTFYQASSAFTVHVDVDSSATAFIIGTGVAEQQQ